MLKHAVIVSFGLIAMGCSAQSEVIPISFVNLPENEVILMDVSECHSGCMKGRIKYENGRASSGDRSIVLTPKEISELDDYMVLGVEGEVTPFCSITVLISMKRKRGLKTISSRKRKAYPCHLLSDTKLVMTAPSLASFLLEQTQEVPYWRDPESIPVLNYPIPL